MVANASRYAEAVVHQDRPAALAASVPGYRSPADFDLEMFRDLGINRVDGAWVDCPDDPLTPLPDGPCFGFDVIGRPVPGDVSGQSIIYSGTLSVAVSPSSGLVVKTGYLGGGQIVRTKSS